MPTSVKIRIRSDKQLSDGKYPIALVITKDRVILRDVIAYCELDEWDSADQLVKVFKTNREDAENINRTIKSRKARAERIVSELEAEDPLIDIKDIMRVIRGNDQGNKITDFYQFAEEVRDRFYQNDKYDSGDCYQAMINKLKGFRPKLSFREIDQKFLTDYLTHISTPQKEGRTKQYSQNTIFSDFKYIASVFNKAERESHVKADHNPFKTFKVHRLRPKQLKPIKDHLTKEEIDKLIALDLSRYPTRIHYLNAFLIAIDFAGMRVFDVMTLKVMDIKNGKLYYSMKKSKDSFGWDISPKSQAIFNQYLPGKDPEDFILPFLNKEDEKDLEQFYLKKKSKNKLLNTGLQNMAKMAGIDKHITSHVARHTFAGLSKDIIPVEMIQSLLGHEDRKTTMIYVERIGQDEMNEALKKVREG